MVLKFIIFSQFMVMALIFGIAFSRILQKKNNKSINFYSFKILFPLWLASLVQLAECRPGKREAMSSPAGRARGPFLEAPGNYRAR